MTYSIEFRPQALRVLRKLDSKNQARIRGAIVLLARDPRPPGSRKLQGRDGYRVRVGDFLVIYAIEDSRLTILVVAIGHRREVYRGAD
jgi:mRNA interferase RelE/StbE